MKPMHQLTAAALTIPIGLAAWHITPTVVLHKQANVIRQTLPNAEQFFVRSVEIGRDDVQRLKAAANFEPEDKEFKFFYGTGSDGAMSGVVLFPQISTRDHGPIELGLTIGTDGSIVDVAFTKATVETKPWVLKVERSGLLDHFKGLRAGDDPTTALSHVSRHELGSMPYYIAEVTAQGVNRGLALYQVLFE
jgi:hypothetical protein